MKPGNGGLAGGGIYFATAPELTGHKAHKKGVILEATVALGKILTLDAAGDPTMTLQKLKSKEYDSVCIARAVSSGQEYVVYDATSTHGALRSAVIHSSHSFHTTSRVSCCNLHIGFLELLKRSATLPAGPDNVRIISSHSHTIKSPSYSV
jgi:hypothetical protein